MATRASAMTGSRKPGQIRRIGPRSPRRSRVQRSLFACALVVFGLAAFVSATNLLSRAWPAIFPGQTLFSINVPGAPPVLGKLPLTSDNEDSAFNRRRNFLILGLDQRPQAADLPQEHLTDVIMVATIDPVSEQASILSFPRDLYVEIHYADGFTGMNRINESYAQGIKAGGTYEAGAKNVALDLRENFGITIDYWVIMDFRGVETLVDAIGGIDIDVPDDLAFYDWWYSDDDTNAQYVTIPPGEQHLDGYHAVAFGRNRDDLQGDLTRIERQQLVISAAASRITAQDILSNPLELWNAYKDTVKTDIGVGQIPGFARLFQETQGRMQLYSLGDPVNGVETVEGATINGAAVLLWNAENVRYWLERAFSAPLYAESNVEIQNAMADGGLEQSEAFARYLLFKGLPTVYVGSDVAPQDHSSIVIHDDDLRPMAEDIANWMNLPFSAIEVVAPAEGTPEVAVVLGADFILPGG